MPNRTIRESTLTSSTLAQLSHGAERFFFRLTLVADDFGRFEADPMVLMAHCFPKMLDRIRAADIARWWAELCQTELVAAYCVGGKQYAYFVTWEKHQTKRALHSKHPDPLSADVCLHLPTDASKCLREARSEKRESRSDNTSPAEPEDAWGRPEHLQALWNRLAPQGLARMTRLSTARRGKCAKYLRDLPDREFWNRCFSELKFSRFLLGHATSPGHESFRADFDWLLSKGRDGTENCVKVAEGKYRDKEAR